ncbi:hypothetical protein ACFXBB_10975 [Streptomyces scopuliridis]|uniref:hypothetical protein n=1 Tax=Streptomyces scopuliridis TaxID=452529 RepID=UPI003674318D
MREVDVFLLLAVAEPGVGALLRAEPGGEPLGGGDGALCLFVPAGEGVGAGGDGGR